MIRTVVLVHGHGYQSNSQESFSCSTLLRPVGSWRQGPGMQFYDYNAKIEPYAAHTSELFSE